MKEQLHLVDELGQARIEAPSPAHVQIQRMEVGRVPRTAVFQHPNSTVRFELPEGFEGGRLRTAAGIKSRAWEGLGSPVRFRVGLERDGTTYQLHSVVLDPRRRTEDRRWVDVEVDVP